MAFSLSNTSTSTPPFLCAPFATLKNHSKSHKALIFPLNSSPKNYPLLTFSSSLNFNNRYGSNLGFKCCFSHEENPVGTINEEGQDEEVENVEETSDKETWESVETLTKFYKEAILAGDVHSITEIETAFYKLETEKNRLVEKVSTMTEEITLGKEKYIRLQADFDNFRKRSEKEKLSVRNNAKGEVIESLLPMVDNFERAKQQIKAETDREKQIDTSYQGIYKQFVEIMRSLQVAAIATVGKPFNPSLHEAIAREESEEFNEGIVSQEFRRGFLLGDRLLRPATVKVSSGPGKKKDASATQQSEQPVAAASVDEP